MTLPHGAMGLSAVSRSYSYYFWPSFFKEAMPEGVVLFSFDLRGFPYILVRDFVVDAYDVA